MVDVAKRLRIHGRVQGVGYRAWFQTKVQSETQLSGWVRNRNDGTVEALVTGASAEVDDLIIAAHSGPAYADVTDIHIEDAVGVIAKGRFDIKPTV